MEITKLFDSATFFSFACYHCVSRSLTPFYIVSILFRFLGPIVAFNDHAKKSFRPKILHDKHFLLSIGILHTDIIDIAVKRARRVVEQRGILFPVGQAAPIDILRNLPREAAKRYFF